MIKTAVCDDEKIVLDEICSKVQNAFSEINCTAEIFKTHKPFDLVEHIKNSTTDVLFLDIDMPSLSGMDIAQFLIDCNAEILLVFVTSHDTLVYQSFRYHPFGFIRKSHFDEEIGAVVKSIADELQKRNEHFSFKTNEGFFKVPFEDIIYFESESNYINLHCTDNQYRFRGTITSLENELKAKGFIRTHKGFLVNQQNIFAIKGDDIELSSKELLPIGRTNRESVKKAILRYMR
ncbi:MAG: LytTR family DNA-binding domain-containing protein [Ruminococcus sp.]|nr:LytTR family DNA-binding domain-containing protein [Ruminococcus sp.]